MTVSELEHFRDLLLNREGNLESLLDRSAFDEDESGKVQALLSEIKGALERVEDETYGTCIICHGHVEQELLEVQPVAQVCLECISREQRAQLEEDLHLASKIHRALLPQAVTRIDGYDIAVQSMAARIIGGDYYDFISDKNDNSTRIVIADTMGKGLPAGLLMSNVQGALRILADDIVSPSSLISRLNQWVCRNVPVTKFISLFCLNVNIGTDGRFTYVNAGHCPPILLKADGNIEQLQPTGAVLGVAESFSYQEASSSFNPGDMLILYTDGVTDASGETDEMFEEQRLLEFIKNNKGASPADLVSGLINEIRTFTGRKDFDDDLTVVAIRRQV